MSDTETIEQANKLEAIIGPEFQYDDEAPVTWWCDHCQSAKPNHFDDCLWVRISAVIKALRASAPAQRRWATYRLPDGTLVAVDDTAAKGASIIDYTLRGGKIVLAIRVNPDDASAPAPAVAPTQEPVLEQVKAALRDLYSVVWGECPSLVREDSGGDANLALLVEAALRAEASPVPAAPRAEGIEVTAALRLLRTRIVILQERVSDDSSYRGSADTEIGNLLAALRAASPVEEGWRQMESAPKDRTKVLAYGAFATDGSLDVDLIRFDHPNGTGKWYFARTGKLLDVDPLGWKPTPPAPTDVEKK